MQCHRATCTRCGKFHHQPEKLCCGPPVRRLFIRDSDDDSDSAPAASQLSHPLHLLPRTLLQSARVAVIEPTMTILPALLLALTACCQAVHGSGVSLLLNGAPATVGTFPFPSAVTTVTFDNGLIRLTFGHVGGSISLESAVMNGTELAKGARTAASFYVDSGGGTASLVCDEVRVLRITPDLVEAVFVDTKSSPLGHAHHLIMTSTTPGIYGYNVMTLRARATITEIRMNVRADRCIFDHAYNHERGHDSMEPSYAYLDTQDKLADETWRVDGKLNPALPCPLSNSANYTPGKVYTKYQVTTSAVPLAIRGCTRTCEDDDYTFLSLVATYLPASPHCTVESVPRGEPFLGTLREPGWAT